MRAIRNPETQPALNRRQFLQGSLALGAGLVVGFHWTPKARGALLASAIDGPAKGAPFAPNAFVRIGTDNTVTVISKHIEFGQGTYTGLATVLAEELDADWEQVRVEAAPSDGVTYANLAFGGPVQGTGGSTAMANSWLQLRVAGNTARTMLVGAAAQEWEVPPAEITVARGVVSHRASGRSATFGELAEKAAQQPEPDRGRYRLKTAEDFELIGKNVPRVDVKAKIDGTAQFTLDVYREGMLTAVVAHPPRFGGQVAGFDASAARKVRGVVEVVEIPTGVAVVAENFWAAKKGRDALKIDWDDSAAEMRGSEEILAEYRALLSEPGLEVRRDGDGKDALEGAAKVLEADYAFPFLAHAPMETLDCVIHLDGDRCEVWAGSQLQTVDHGVVAAVTGLPPQNVQIHTLLGGGSFGRRATPTGDIAFETASLAKALGARGRRNPIKVVWTREDDIRGGRYRPLYAHRLRAGLDAEGNLIAWHHRIVGQSIVKGTPFEAALVQNGIDNTSVEGASTLPYAIPHLEVDLHTTDVQIPVLWWRSVGHTHHAYSTETFLDEVAKAAGKDPVVLRRALLQKHRRHLGVLNLAAGKAGWGTPLPSGRARGVAVHESFGSFVAQVAEVSVGGDGLPKVHRVVCAVDCGVAINPDNIAAQMEGGLGYGLGAALFNEVEIVEGRVVPGNFRRYRSLRISEMPRVEVHIVPSDQPPTGVGEPGVPPIAPAVANAFVQLTGKPVRRLPFTRSQEG
jgi:isoquinoline 1-oxidoreductase beta subunit